MSTVEQLQKEAQEISERYQKSENAMTELNTQIQQNQVALNENMTVKKELDSLKEGQKVYKLVGPVLLRVDVEEAKSNVDNRIKLIQRQADDLADKAKKEKSNYDKATDDMIRLQQRVAMMKVENLPKPQ